MDLEYLSDKIPLEMGGLDEEQMKSVMSLVATLVRANEVLSKK